jgi:hypothetical protein
MTDRPEHDEATEELIAEFMTRVAALPLPKTLPDPMQLWWKARLLERRAAEHRARLPIDVIQPIEIAAGLIAAAWLLYSFLLTLLGAYGA